MSQFKLPPAWTGRDDTEDGEAGYRWHHIVNQKHSAPGIALIGLACDLGVANNKGRLGAAEGPDVIRSALSNLAWHGQAPVKDLGTVVADQQLIQAQQHYAMLVTQALIDNHHVVGLGGGHEIAWASYSGLFDALNNKQSRIGIINLDAHFDLRKPSPHISSGTPFRQIHEHRLAQQLDFSYSCLGVAQTANTKALFDYAHSSGTRYLLDHQCTIDAAKSLLRPQLEQIDELYLTICLDAFPAANAPGVSAPSALGIPVLFAIEIIQWLKTQQIELGFKWRMTDIAEMNPTFDIDSRTAKLAARLIFEVCR